MALGLYRAEFHSHKYFFKGLEDGFCCGYKEATRNTLKENVRGHYEEEIVDRILLAPQQLLTFNTETE